MNKKVIQYKSQILDPKNNNETSVSSNIGNNSNKLLSIIKANNNTLRKAKGLPSATSVWSNSIYSFNKNYLKAIPVVDNVVNKLIKSFFTMEALANNPRGKKSRLIQRRYKRLSLNRILVSKSEIRHSSSKVFITVYLFNKKRKSIMIKLKEMYKSLFVDKTYSSIQDNTNTPVLNFVSKNSESNSFSTSKLLPAISRNKIKTQKLISRILFNEYAFIESISSKSGASKKYLLRKNKLGNSGNEYLNGISYYKNLKNLTNNNINSFMSSLSNEIHDSSLETSLRNHFKNTNKYRLYNDKQLGTVSANTLNPSFDLSSIKSLSLPYTALEQGRLRKPNYSIYKLKSMYKLFNLYNNIGNFAALSQNSVGKSIYSRKMILNAYKLLKKDSIKLDNLYKTALVSQNNLDKESNTISKKYKLGLGTDVQRNLTNTRSYLSLRKDMKSLVIISRLNRIERFFDKYKDTILNSKYSILPGSAEAKNIEIMTKSIINNYKVNFINDLLEKELLYIYYLKLLSYNNAMFKSWFLYPLKTLFGKLYNKEVIFNIVNLKYMHLNSDIFSQAVNIRLRNFRKNKLVNVLKKAIKLVSISKVNIYACDENSAIYKYIHNYHNKFRNLKLDIFKELGILENKTSLQQNTDLNYLLSSGTLPKIRRLNHIQTSTINFIKYRSVFGVRLETAGRLTKRSTASRSIFKYRYKGTLRSSPVVNNSISSTIIKNNMNSNLQFTKIASKTRNGSFGIKGWINSN